MKGEISVVDMRQMTEKLKEDLTIDPKSTVVIAVDMHRGHLDPEVATQPVPPEESRRVIRNTVKLLQIVRKCGIPTIYVVLQFRSKPKPGAEQLSNPFWASIDRVKESLTPGRKSTIRDHNLVGSVQVQIIPEIAPGPNDYVIDNKKRLDSFYGTDLDILLRVLKVDTVIIIGVNTNTCVLNAAFAAFNRDLKTIVISDCVASMYGEDLHHFGLQNISRCLGWVLTVPEMEELLAGSNVNTQT